MKTEKIVNYKIKKQLDGTINPSEHKKKKNE